MDWHDICAKAKTRDMAMLKEYDNEIDTLLVFVCAFLHIKITVLTLSHRSGWSFLCSTHSVHN